MSALRGSLTEAVDALKAAMAVAPEELRNEHESDLLEDVGLLGELLRLGGALGVKLTNEVDPSPVACRPPRRTNGVRSVPRSGSAPACSGRHSRRNGHGWVPHWTPVR